MLISVIPLSEKFQKECGLNKSKEQYLIKIGFCSNLNQFDQFDLSQLYSIWILFETAVYAVMS